MKITFSGTPGSGKSTMSKEIANFFKLELTSTGDFMRKIAKRYKYNDITKFLTEYVSFHPEIDKEVDNDQTKYGLINKNFVLDAHLGFYCVPDSLKICLTCNFEEAGKRIFNDNRESEKLHNIEESVNKSIERRKVMKKNFLKLYKVNIEDPNNFDIVIDTTFLKKEDVFEKIKNLIQRKIN